MFPKPEPIKRVKGRRKRAEAVVKKEVRRQVCTRDGYCRVNVADRVTVGTLGRHEGLSEWAHLEEKRRSKTRGMNPEERHTTQDTVMFCTRHHQMYDARQFSVEFFDRFTRADGLIRLVAPGGGTIFEETPAVA